MDMKSIGEALGMMGTVIEAARRKQEAKGYLGAMMSKIMAQKAFSRPTEPTMVTQGGYEVPTISLEGASPVLSQEWQDRVPSLNLTGNFSKANTMDTAAMLDFLENTKAGQLYMQAAEKSGIFPGITSGNLGKHAPNSRHYPGNAIDVNSYTDGFDKFVAAMKELGAGWGGDLYGDKERHHFEVG